MRLLRTAAEVRQSFLRESRRSQFWRAALVGALAGGFAVLFQLALTGAESLRQGLVHVMVQFGHFRLVTSIVFCSSLAGAAGYLTLKFCPEAAGSGIPHVKAVLLNVRQLRWIPVMCTKFVGGFLSIAAGMSLGREGPTVHIGACMGRAVAEKLRVPKRSHRTLIAAGAGAGLTAAFNAPLAGFLFVLEEMLREMTPTTYGAALIASVCADAVTRMFLGQRPSFRITGYEAPSLKLLPAIAVLGLLAGLVGVVYNRALLGAGKLMGRFGWWKSALVGTIAALTLWFAPDIAGGGHRTAEIVLSGEYAKASALWTLAALLFGKLLFTALSYGSGVPGGIFAPLLVIGAYLGLLFGQLTHMLLPSAPVNSAAFAVLGMAALFSSSVRAPLTGIVLIVEMTSNYEQLYALIVVALVAYLTAEALREPPIYEAMLERDLHKADPAAHGQVEPVLTELFVEPGSYLAGRQVEEIRLPASAVLLSILRGKNEFAPPAKFHIKAGDVVVFLLEAPDARLTHALSKLARH
jgi:CIC family chloride channel protein